MILLAPGPRRIPDHQALVPDAIGTVRFDAVASE